MKIGIALMMLILFVYCIAAAVQQHRSDQCEAKGGVYTIHKCFRKDAVIE